MKSAAWTEEKREDRKRPEHRDVFFPDSLFPLRHVDIKLWLNPFYEISSVERRKEGWQKEIRTQNKQTNKSRRWEEEIYQNKIGINARMQKKQKCANKPTKNTKKQKNPHHAKIRIDPGRTQRCITSTFRTQKIIYIQIYLQRGLNWPCFFLFYFSISGGFFRFFLLSFCFLLPSLLYMSMEHDRGLNILSIIWRWQTKTTSLCWKKVRSLLILLWTPNTNHVTTTTHIQSLSHQKLNI
jgi:hypothetical protein